MIRKLTLEERVDLIERKLKPTNEASALLAKVVPLVIKNLPLILNVLPSLITAFKSDQLNDNTEKIDTLEKFAEIGKEVIAMFDDKP